MNMNKKLRQYKYEFEWEHGKTASMITKFLVKTPRSGKFVSQTNGASVIVYGMTSDEPFVKFSNFPLQHLEAIVAEIKRERDRLVKAMEDAEREVKVGTIPSSRIHDNAYLSLRAADYLED